MSKHFRRALFLCLFHDWDYKMYHQVFQSYYDADTTPMWEIIEVIGEDKFQEADNVAKELQIIEPKVVE
jgi:hypothetical protein